MSVVADEHDRRGWRGKPLPLPPPEDDGATRIRLAEYLPGGQARDLPRLPAEPLWTLHDGFTADGDDDDESSDGVSPFIGEQTSLDAAPPVPVRDDHPPAAAAAPVIRESPRGSPRDSPRTRLPLPARDTPPPVTRPTNPGSKVRRTATTGPPPAPAAMAPQVRAQVASRPTELADQGGARTPTGDPDSEARRLVGGRYRIVERIGQGGMGKVYKVAHTQLDKVFALKVISGTIGKEVNARELFYREARLASSLSHPNIASVVDFGEDDQLGAFMVMEFLSGEPLNRALHREKQLGVRQACDIILQVAEALRYIHANDIVHCDIKTENILLCEVIGGKRRQQQVKLLDFGLARSLSTLRQTSSLSGTPHYVAPERIQGQQPSPSSDIYSIGILFYELLTGKVPWDGQVPQILHGHLELQPTPPSRLIEGGLDPALETLILHALAKTPAERHKDMPAFLYELRTVMDMLGFGQRRKHRRVVIERGEHRRDELARTLFDACRLPMALLASSGLILVANASFARFVMGAVVDVEGLTVQSTPLAGVWTSLENDIIRACNGHHVRRVLEIDVEAGVVRRMMLWLDPLSADQVTFGLHPLDR